MDKEQAEMVAKGIGGDTFQSGGGIYLVTKSVHRGKFLVISSEMVCLYGSEKEFDEGENPENEMFIY